MTPRVLIILTLLFFSFRDDSTTYTLLKSIPGSASIFTTDELGNVYLVKNNVLEKYDRQGNFLSRYNNKNLGALTLVNASNPMKILLYYKNFSRIILLDNMLSETSSGILLDELGYIQTPVVCSSHNNGIWIYNPVNFELVRYDQTLQPSYRTGNIAQQAGHAINPVFLLEQNNTVFLSCPTHGILTFDIYGTYLKTIPIKNLNSFQIINNTLLYYRNGVVNGYNLKTVEEKSISTPDTTAVDIRTEKARLFLLKQKSLDIYHVK